MGLDFEQQLGEEDGLEELLQHDIIGTEDSGELSLEVQVAAPPMWHFYGQVLRGKIIQGGKAALRASAGGVLYATGGMLPQRWQRRLESRLGEGSFDASKATIFNAWTVMPLLYTAVIYQIANSEMYRGDKILLGLVVGLLGLLESGVRTSFAEEGDSTAPPLVAVPYWIGRGIRNGVGMLKDTVSDFTKGFKDEARERQHRFLSGKYTE